MTHFHDNLQEPLASGDESMYQENILDHAAHPRNAGRLPDATFAHREMNQSCGDTIEVSVLLEGDRVKDVRFDGHGCAISQAAVSMLTERLKGLTVAQAAALSQRDVFDLLGFPVGVTRIRCALLGLRTVQTGLAAHLGVAGTDAPAHDESP